jgi:hypothetical protein
VVAGEDAGVLGGVEGAAAELTAGRTGPGTVNGVVVVSCSMSCKKSYDCREGVGDGEDGVEAKGNVDSSNTTWRDMMIFWVERSRQR